MIRSRSANFLMYCVCVLAMMSACKTSSNATSDEASDLVGAPPSTGQDPFASQVKPPESARVPTSGVMDVSTKTPSESEAVVVEEKDPSSSDPVEPEDIEQSPRARVEPATPAPETLESRVKQTEVAKQPDVYQCFSCVKICPESDPTSDCSRSQEDMICGWGVSQRERDAATLAQAECGGALGMARQMPTYREISGECPVATCIDP